MVLRGLERHRLPAASPARFSSSKLPRRLFRHHRNQHLFLPAAPPTICRSMASPRGRKSALPLHSQTLAEIHARRRDNRRGCSGRPRRLRSSSPRRKTWRGVAPVSVFIPSHARKYCPPRANPRFIPRLPPRRGGPPCILVAEGI